MPFSEQDTNFQQKYTGNFLLIANRFEFILNKTYRHHWPNRLKSLEIARRPTSWVPLDWLCCKFFVVWKFWNWWRRRFDELLRVDFCESESRVPIRLYWLKEIIYFSTLINYFSTIIKAFTFCDFGYIFYLKDSKSSAYGLMFASLDWSALSRDIAACAFKFLGNVKNNIIAVGE